MKVIEPGREQKWWAKEFRCTGHGNGGGGCNALLLVEHADVYETTSSCMGESERHNTFECPCGVETDIEHVPFYVKPRASRG